MARMSLAQRIGSRFSKSGSSTPSVDEDALSMPQTDPKPLVLRATVIAVCVPSTRHELY